MHWTTASRLSIELLRPSSRYDSPGPAERTGINLVATDFEREADGIRYGDRSRGTLRIVWGRRTFICRVRCFVAQLWVYLFGCYFSGGLFGCMCSNDVVPSKCGIRSWVTLIHKLPANSHHPLFVPYTVSPETKMRLLVRQTSNSLRFRSPLSSSRPRHSPLRTSQTSIRPPVTPSRRPCPPTLLAAIRQAPAVTRLLAALRPMAHPAVAL